MKKSIMLSATIMLVILFLTLTTTTFAWYQAQGGEIHVSGSSTASVTTTGPDSPYLVISATNSFGSVTASNYGSYMTITPSQVSNLYVELAYPTFTAGVLTGFTSPATGQTNTSNVLKYTYYIKNIGDMDLLADFTAYKSSTNLSNPGDNNDLHFAYMISLSDGNTTSYYYTSYYDASHVLQTPTSANTLADITISANTMYTVNFYVWVNNEAQFNNSNSVDSIALAIGNALSLKFENVEIKTTN